MMEKLKTLLLTSLILASLIQSYLLVFSGPKFDEVSPAGYVKTELIGAQESVDDLIFPTDIVLHLGDAKHNVLYPGIHYNLIFQRMKQRTFDGFRRSSSQVMASEWQEIRNNHIGFELRFRGGIPLSVLHTQKIIQVKGDIPPDSGFMITKIWFYVTENKEEVKTFFFTDNPLIVFEATKADLNVKDVETSIGFGEIQGLYRTSDGDIYLPEAPIPSVELEMSYEKISGTQLQNNFFVDPDNTRNFRDRDGSDIYTDGKRGLQVKNDQAWMSYTDPIPLVDIRNEVIDNLNSAVLFINQYGGWNGTFLAAEIPQLPLYGRQTFVFRQYMNQMPIINEPEDDFGYMRVVIQRGVVSHYERSLIQMDSRKAERREAMLPGGKDLEQLITDYPRSYNIIDIFPAYKPTVTDKHVTLTPKWGIELRDGTYDFLN
jgi:regulatory protein YycH of two-component signal transduction system YycFG